VGDPRGAQDWSLPAFPATPLLLRRFLEGSHVIIILGSVQVAAERRDAAIALGLEHCARSRSEPGCLAHDCHVDAADAGKLVFVERWADMASVRTHFAVPASGDFVRRLTALASEAPLMHLYEVSEPIV